MKRFRDLFSLESLLVSGEPTFHHSNQNATSAIDTILFYLPAKSEVKIEPVYHLCKLENSANLSSHDVIVGALKIPLAVENNVEIDFTNTYAEFVVNKPKWDELGISNYQEQTFKVLSDLFDKYKGPEFIPALSEMC